MNCAAWSRLGIRTPFPNTQMNRSLPTVMETRLERVLRHLPAYLVRGQKSYSILLEQSDRFREVCVRIGYGIGVGRNLHPFCRNTHLFEGVIEAARSDD